MRQTLVEKFRILLHIPIKDLQLLTRLLKALNQIFLWDLFYVLEGAAGIFYNDLVQFATEVLYTSLEVEEHLFDFVVGFLGFFVFNLSLS